MARKPTIEQQLASIDALADLLKDKCREARIELGLVQAPAPRKGKGVDPKTAAAIIAKRNATALRKA